ncbi:Uncharacterised protein [Shigella sonnei]|nr:Uncharacterised protein [Shigella sonnei]
MQSHRWPRARSRYAQYHARKRSLLPPTRRARAARPGGQWTDSVLMPADRGWPVSDGSSRFLSCVRHVNGPDVMA